MIIGIGTDLTEIDRVRSLLARPKVGERFLCRVLTVSERQAAEVKSQRLAEFVAGRFAAKEAVVKALGCGIGQAVGFQDIEVLADPAGRPVCTLSPAARRRLNLEEAAILHVSITHSSSMASAFAVAEV
ncbi:holo-ACP synthase [Gorillibacterium massiliense]|uniref:holo-ACP synthase n=1 Tax=Gorillibacterium massiliense TaxID=1280390 RepID=UPI0004ACF060|nr:holo-ACP synthase [Gorillibacterium massiliense]